jgi:hypothetical protein
MSEMARYIDADALLERMKRTPRYFDIKHDVEQMPTADVVPRSNEGEECPVCHGTGRIGTTDWLTKRISKEQLAKEKAEAVAEYDRQLKAEVAREIFVEVIDAWANSFTESEFLEMLKELKKKFTGGNDET